ncbi:DNA-damage-inducible protein J [Volucribacter psittacicida]|uniref:DNA-damage-inducible protein J n=1 Tax=Volucribacter psittacicida TaxID=203482 RepID=A0A4R1FT69_9PAST|nr:type II toxin-antitoxin system RelB/DinJ family antitoxin [Volucribacter psittacicida]TCJ98426.1 DNA-damage-inducible protein J [Volucribacter psittacicida]
MSNNFNMHFDAKTKQQFAEVLAEYGLTIPQAFKLFANQVIKTKTVPLSFAWQAEQTSLLQDHVLAILQQNQREQAEGKTQKFASLTEMMSDLADE